MHLRWSKILFVATNAFFLLLVVFNNLTDYGSNFAFVENVLNMSTTFEGNKAMWRAIESPVIHHLFYATIILWEAAAMVLLGIGSYALFKNRRASAQEFRAAKKFAILGLTVSMLQWYVAFICVGAEWFLMWQSPTWNGQDAAMRMFLMMGVCLVYLVMPEDEEPSLTSAAPV
jgi:predicted small integral membrane protein